MNTVNERGIGSDLRRNYIASGESGGTLGISIVQGREVPETNTWPSRIRALCALKEHRNLLLAPRANLMMVLTFRRPRIPVANWLPPASLSF
jgi:hypothetical protein